MDSWQTEPDARALPTGTVNGLLNGRYRLGELLGSGGMADVYAARDTQLGRDVAIKFFRPLDDAHSKSRFVTEARMLANLSHPALVTVYDASLGEDRRPYLIMRLLGGGTLRQHIAHGPLAPDRVARYGTRLASALAHVHAHEIIHRDIKPANVLIDHTDACYLGDFGLAWVRGSAQLTNSGEFVGTAGYFAPEQVAGDLVGSAADVYALGLVLLECLTGQTEYPGSDVEAAVARLSRQPVVPVSLGQAWHELLIAMTARVPADRPSAADCAYQLRTVARHADPRDRTLTRPTAGRASAPEQPLPARPPQGHGLDASTQAMARRGTRLASKHVVGLGAVGVAGIVLTAMFLATPNSSSTPGAPLPGETSRHTVATPNQPDQRDTPAPVRGPQAPAATADPATSPTRPGGDGASADPPSKTTGPELPKDQRPHKGSPGNGNTGHKPPRH